MACIVNMKSGRYDWVEWLERMKQDPDVWHLVRADAPYSLPEKLRTLRLAALRGLPSGALKVVRGNSYTDDFGARKCDVYALYSSGAPAPAPPVTREVAHSGGTRSISLPEDVVGALRRTSKDRGAFVIGEVLGGVVRKALDEGSDYVAPRREQQVMLETTIKISDEEWQAFTHMATQKGVGARTLARYEIAKLAASVDPNIDPKEVER